jgi:hypothetical protein
MTRMRAILGLILLHACAAQAAYDANDIALGASEKAVLKQFPAAHCAPLQWKSKAAERRCDDSKIVLGGVPGRITFYLKRDRVEAFDVRVDTKTRSAWPRSSSSAGAPADADAHESSRRAAGRSTKWNGKRAKSAPC